jgi:hypothetical protein
MPGDEKLKKDHEESDSDEEDELEVVPQVDIDVTKLSALSPEVISKQVRTDRLSICCLILKDVFQATINLGAHAHIRKSSTYTYPSGRRYDRPCRAR